jgi:hypothetical protein
MNSLKSAIVRVAGALTGQATTRASLDALARHIDAAAASNREVAKRLKDATDGIRDRLSDFERQIAHDREAVQSAIAQLRDQQAHAVADVADLRRLMQRTYRALVDNDVLDERSLDRKALADHISRAIGGAPMRQHPFPHLVIPNVLPEWFYDLLLRAIPAPTFWRNAGYMRDNWHIVEDAASRFSESTWRFMHSDVAAHVIMPLLLNRFGEEIASYWRETFVLDSAQLNGHYICDEGRLLLRRAGYKLEPHLDPPSAILTFLMYLARPGDAEAHGTDLYASGPLPARRTGIWYPARQGVELQFVATVPFRSNTALVFITPQSVHGAELPADSDPSFERVSYQFLASLDDEGRRIVQRHWKTRAATATT